MLGYLSADVICSEKRTVFRELSSRKAVSYEEQIMSDDKYPSTFSPQMEAIVFIIHQIFFAIFKFFFKPLFNVDLQIANNYANIFEDVTNKINKLENYVPR